jgi:hypothetical protein
MYEVIRDKDEKLIAVVDGLGDRVWALRIAHSRARAHKRPYTVLLNGKVFARYVWSHQHQHVTCNVAA